MSISKRKRLFLGLAAGIFALCSVGCFLLTSGMLPQLRRDYEVQTGPTYIDPNDTPRFTFYIRSPFSVIRDRLEDWREGGGSGSSGPEFWALVNEDSDEVFMLYPGRVTLTEYPYARNEKVEPGSQASWCTLVYRPGNGPSFTENIARWFK